jgi:hypothetical protein
VAVVDCLLRGMSAALARARNGDRWRTTMRSSWRSPRPRATVAAGRAAGGPTRRSSPGASTDGAGITVRGDDAASVRRVARRSSSQWRRHHRTRERRCALARRGRQWPLPCQRREICGDRGMPRPSASPAVLAEIGDTHGLPQTWRWASAPEPDVPRLAATTSTGTVAPNASRQCGRPARSSPSLQRGSVAGVLWSDERPTNG